MHVPESGRRTAARARPATAMGLSYWQRLRIVILSGSTRHRYPDGRPSRSASSSDRHDGQAGQRPWRIRWRRCRRDDSSAFAGLI